MTNDEFSEGLENTLEKTKDLKNRTIAVFNKLKSEEKVISFFKENEDFLSWHKNRMLEVSSLMIKEWDNYFEKFHIEAESIDVEIEKFVMSVLEEWKTLKENCLNLKIEGDHQLRSDLDNQMNENQKLRKEKQKLLDETLWHKAVRQFKAWKKAYNGN
jgi:hypothetical protein